MSAAIARMPQREYAPGKSTAKGLPASVGTSTLEHKLFMKSEARPFRPGWVVAGGGDGREGSGWCASGLAVCLAVDGRERGREQGQCRWGKMPTLSSVGVGGMRWGRCIVGLTVGSVRYELRLPVAGAWGSPCRTVAGMDTPQSQLGAALDGMVENGELPATCMHDGFQHLALFTVMKQGCVFDVSTLQVRPSQKGAVIVEWCAHNQARRVVL